ncbi:MAG: hypothetical protein KAT68_00915 [Bacteroidales bacterium]|nr:hypothetical protein [Bacteroidales bacterium]
MKIIKFILFFLIIIPTNNIYSQYYNSGQDPFSVKWKQINTSNFQVIYSENIENEAQRFANILEYIYDKASKSLNHQPKKISVIIHSQSAVSNGSVAWAPKRMEIYTTPPQGIYSQDWLEQLAIHEFRHVVQIDKLNQGLTRVLSFIFGEQAVGLVLGLYLPLWLLEGDAVCTETALSKSGRGRIPSFEMKLRAQVLEKRIYTYDKAVYGSYKDFTPNCYELGYQIVTNARKKYGKDIWANTIKKVGRGTITSPIFISSINNHNVMYTSPPMPFTKSIKEQTGLSKVKFYKNIFSELSENWKKQNDELNFTETKQINLKNKSYTNYKSPRYLNDSLIITLKSGIDDITRIISIDNNGREEIVHTPGFMLNNFISSSDKITVWSEYIPDIRWQHRDYSVIKYFDYQTNKVKQLTKKTKLYAPSVSKNGKKIVAVNVSEDNKYSLLIFDTQTGEEIQKIKYENNDFFVTPKWSKDNNNIISIVQNSKGKSIVKINSKTSDIQYLIPFTYKEISNPVEAGNYIYYSASYSGIDNIYALDINSKETFQVTSVKFGATNPDISPDNKYLIFSDYSSSGYNVSKIELDKTKWIPLVHVKDNSLKIYEDIARQENIIIESKNIPSVKYHSKKYVRFDNLINTHSWAPVSISYINSTIQPGITVMSQNELGTVVASAGFGFTPYQIENMYFLDVTYMGFFPVLYTRFEYIGRYDYLLNPDRYIFWDETNFKFGVSLPLNITNGKYRRFIQPRLTLNHINIYPGGNYPNDYPHGTKQSFGYSLEAYNSLKSVTKNVYPRWKQYFNVNYKHLPFEGKNSGSIFSLYLACYFPGIIKHHGIKIKLGYQKKTSGNYIYSDLLAYPRGYFNQYNNELKLASLSYKLPLLYPDISLGPFFYIKRIKAENFIDYAVGNQNDYCSVGTELTSDLHFIRLITPFEFGVLLAYKINKNEYFHQFILNINF